MRMRIDAGFIYNSWRRAFYTGNDAAPYRRNLDDAIPYPLQPGTCLRPDDGDVYMLESRAEAFMLAEDWSNWRGYALLPRVVVDEFCPCGGLLEQPLYRQPHHECTQCGVETHVDR